MLYNIKTILDPSQLDRGNTAAVNIYNWGGSYRPKTEATLCYVKDRGFIVRLLCAETAPRAVHTKADSPVCEDSCLEFFVNFQPDKPGNGYINFEGNANGAMLCHYGPSRNARSSIVSMGLSHPVPTVIQTAANWGWQLLIPLSWIHTLYGSVSYSTGSRIRGNFFKCGDKTDSPHYASYTKIDSPNPDFHRPEYFANMIITD